MITREADYTIRAVLHLAGRDDPSRPVSTGELADAMDIPYRFLRKLVGRMVTAGLVNSQRGKGGGVTLAKPPKNISLLDVLMAVDSRSVTLNRCLADDLSCDRSGFCAVHQRLTDVQEVMARELRAITFDRLVD